ncbi:MAG: AI-2E family transporter, partial [Lachnospiraceae bacterium]|nr:AI-2E family transporter [Lachnospiraceae bacterium]
MSDFLLEKIFNRKNKEFLIVTGVVLGVYFVMKFVSPLITPFLFAFIFVAFLHPHLEKIQKRLRIRKGFMAFLIILLTGIILAATIGWIGNALYHKAMEILGQMDVIEEQFGIFLRQCCESIERRFGFDGTFIETFILEQVDIQIENLEINVMPKLMGGSFVYLKNIFGLLAFLAVMIISILLLIKDYDKIINKAVNYKQFYCIVRIGRKVIEYIRTFLRAQFIILGIISSMCALTLWLIGIKGGIIIGIIAGVMELLPFIGTGIILVPLSLIQLLTESYWQAGVCILLYGACAFTREMLEPKLIGNKMGIWPVAILFAVYVGLKLFGLMGIIKGPVGLVIIFET